MSLVRPRGRVVEASMAAGAEAWLATSRSRQARCRGAMDGQEPVSPFEAISRWSRDKGLMTSPWLARRSKVSTSVDTPASMDASRSRQAVRRWGNSLAIRLPSAIARQARMREDQPVELSVVDGGVLIQPVSRRLSLAERLATYEPMDGEPVEAMAWEPLGAERLE